MVGPIEDSLRSIIRHGLSLQVECVKCSRKVLVDARLIARKFDPATSIHRLPFSCTVCRTRKHKIIAYPPEWK